MVTGTMNLFRAGGAEFSMSSNLTLGHFFEKIKSCGIWHLLKNTRSFRSASRSSRFDDYVPLTRCRSKYQIRPPPNLCPRKSSVWPFEISQSKVLTDFDAFLTLLGRSFLVYLGSHESFDVSRAHSRTCLDIVPLSK